MHLHSGENQKVPQQNEENESTFKWNQKRKKGNNEKT